MTRPRLGDSIRKALRGAAVAGSLTVIAAVAVLGLALSQGYRPVIITTGSMDPAAPPGSVVIARPVNRVEVGDVLVMRRDGRATITHRVVEVERNDVGHRFAVTRGDANADIDAAPYALGSTELVGRWVVPTAGRALMTMGSPVIGLAVIVAAALALIMAALRRIWSHAPGDSGEAESAAKPLRSARSERVRSAGVATLVGVALTGSGVAWSLYLGVDGIPGNLFSTSDCFDARLRGVQSGQLINSTAGLQTQTIGAVDPTSSFVIFSTRSNSNEPDESQVMGLLADSTTLEFIRSSNSAAGSITIEWSVVEYECGVSVQRGALAGDGTSQIDVPVSAVDPAASFVLGSSAPPAGATDHDLDDIQIFELAAPDTVRIRTTGAPLDPTRQMAWQVVTFTSPGDAKSQSVATTLGAGTTSDTVTLPTPVDPATTFVLASVVSPATGPDIGERMVRVRLVDATTIEVVRSLSTESVEVHVQVVELLDGSTVEHGVVDLGVSQTTASATVGPVDDARSVAFSPVMIPGSSSGGATDAAIDDIVGEGSATVVLSDPTTVSVTRAASASSASFAWQVVSWGGPNWADSLSPFRQRVDITAGGVDAPAGYSTPLTIDHAALVDSGLSLATGDDLRIWRFDGSTWTELDRVLDDSSGWNAIDTTLWFRTQESVAATDSISYWLYFGNPTPAAPLVDPANVWLLSEGFEGAGLGAFEDRTAGTGWYRAQPWTRRIVVTIDRTAVGADLTDHPVLVRLTDPDLAASAQPDGSDLRFTAADGLSALDHEIEAWDPVTGTLSAWVRVPLVGSGSDTIVHLYFGAPDAPSQGEPNGVWVGEIGTWNLARDPGGPAPTLDDSGAANHDGLALGDPALVTTGTGLAADLDGTLDRLESAPFDLPDGPLTVAAWIRPDVLGTDPVLVAQGDPTGTGVFELAIDTTTSPGTPTGRFRLRSGGTLTEVSGGTINAGAWHHVVATWDGTTVTLYVDGSVVGSGLASGTTPDGTSIPVVVGGDAAGLRTLDGLVEQVRLSSSAWSAARVSFTESNLRSPTTIVAAAPATAGTWFDHGAWAMRRPLVVDAGQVAGTLTDYPLLVQLVDADLAANAQADGDDLVFVAADGISRLDHELESWNAATGAISAWVRVPTLDGVADTTLFLYLANPTAVDQQDPIGVWGSDTDLVLNN